MIEISPTRGTWPPASGGVAVRFREASGAEGWTTAPQLSDLSLTAPTDFAFGRLIANRLALPQCRLLVNMCDSATGTVVDHSGMARHLTINGNPTFAVHQETGLPEVPYIDLDGTGDYLSIADAAWHSITGALTLMGWYKPDDATPASAGFVAAKLLAAGNQRAYALIHNTDGTLLARVSSNGTATTDVTTTAVMADATWHHCALRYIPSTELSVFLNGVEVLNTTSIPAAIFDSTADFTLGAGSGGAAPVAGHEALWSLHAVALSDAAMAACFAQEKRLFGVS